MIKKKIFKSKTGFTLVEMMIVIAIIGLLAFLAMTAFGSANRSAKLDIAVDTFVSVIRQQQGLAKSGSVDSTATTGVPANQGVFCYGVRFTADTGVEKKSAVLKSDQVQVMLIKVPYVRLGPVKVDYCEDIKNEHLTAFTSVTDVMILGIRWKGEAKNRIDILFKPPFAKAEVIEPIELIKAGSLPLFIDFEQSKDLQIVVKSAVSEERQRIIFSPAGGTVHKENITAP
jgi:prepilin-type N-terminal cleavage/methylation domain-containing protein